MTETFIQAAERTTKELESMADFLEAKDFENEHTELIELARYTASHNPVSETAVDLTEQLTLAIKEY